MRSYQQAAEAGADDAQYRLGLIYSCGQQGVAMDYVMAHMWLNVAAMNGNHAARELRKEISGDMSREEIAEAQRLARQWVQTRH
ncbi:MAG: sel1 repeat family protein [Alphaproteobacteria bacterium]|nr:sel1 repeat family protein [Alphaproteobacteria bacterium]